MFYHPATKTQWHSYTHKGKRFMFNTGKADKAEAAVWVKIHDEQIAKGLLDPFKLKRKAHRVTLSDILDRYLDWLKSPGRQRGVTTKGGYGCALHAVKHLKSFFGDTHIENLREQMDAWKSDYKSGGAKGCNRALTVLKASLNMAVREWRLIDSNPIQGYKGEFTEPISPRRRVVEDAELQALLNAMEEDVWVTFFLFLRDTGSRPGAALKLDWKDVDLARGTCVFRKTKSGRDVPIPLPERIVGRLILTPSALRRGPVFINRKGRPASANLMGKAWKDALKKSKIPHAVVYDLRHSFITKSLERGADISSVARLVGHSDLRMLQHYTRLSDKHLRISSELASAKIVIPVATAKDVNFRLTPENSRSS